MKRKVFICLFAIICISACLFGVTACIPAHEHLYSEDWSTDANYHWHSATCEHTDEVSGKESHIGEWTVSVEATCTKDGTENFLCTECGYTVTRDIKSTGHIYSEEWQSNSNYHWHDATCEHEDEMADYAFHNYANGVCVNCGYNMNSGLMYKLSSGNRYYSVIGVGSYADKILSIPAVYNGKPVEAIADNAFIGSTFEEISIPYGVTSIGANAFYNCSLLKKIVLPDTVTTIGSYAFYGCRSLVDITLPFGITEIADGAFYNCASLRNTVVIGSNVAKIGNAAFAWCSSLSNINIPYSVKTIGNSAFSECSALKNVTLSDSITNIGEGAFFNCSSLTDINLPDSITTIASNIFDCCTSLSKITIPNTVKSIGKYAFSECRSLKEIIVPDKVTEIGEAAFANCSSLNVISVPDSIKKVGKYVFKGCEQVHTLSLPAIAGVDIVNYIPKTRLNTIIITSGSSIEDNMFADCSQLKNIVIADSVTSIGSNAFYGCVSLTNITIPKCITSIGNGAFDGCDSLKYNTYSHINYLGNNDNPCIVLVGTNNKSYNNYEINRNTKLICGNAFKNCTSLESIEIPEGVSFIGDMAFYYCNNLTSVSIPQSVSDIGNNVFYSCNKIKNVIMPTQAIEYIPKTNLQTVEIIGGSLIDASAFRNCTSLKSISIADSVTTIGNNAFYGCNQIQSAAIPAQAIAYIPKTNLQTVEIISGSRIDANAFSDCTSLKSISIAESVTYIGYNAFYGCSQIQNATVPTLAIDYIPKTNLQTVEIISGNRIAANAFSNCTSLKSISIADSVTYIGNNAFYRCSSLTKVTIPNGVTEIGSSAFSGCSSLTSVTIPNSVTSIKYNAFYNCGLLTRINFVGTQAQWNYIEKESGWDTYTGNYEVYYI